MKNKTKCEAIYQVINQFHLSPLKCLKNDATSILVSFEVYLCVTIERSKFK